MTHSDQPVSEERPVANGSPLGPSPFALLRPLLEVSGAIYNVWERTRNAAFEDWPKTEREILRRHKAFLQVCMDLVDGAIAEIDRAEANATAARGKTPEPPAGAPAREVIPVE